MPDLKYPLKTLDDVYSLTDGPTHRTNPTQLVYERLFSVGSSTNQTQLHAVIVQEKA